MTFQGREASVRAAALGIAAALSGCYMRVVPLAKDDAAADAIVADASAADVLAPPTDVPAAPDVLPPRDVAPAVDVGGTGTGAGSVDLLLVIDNSGSMRSAQDYLNASVAQVVNGLIDRFGVRDVRVGVISTDLGTRGVAVPSCLASEGGDDAVMNPRARGAAMALQTQEPPPVDTLCGGLRDLPYMTLRSGDDAMYRYWAPSCHAALGTRGCGLEQPLEAARRALVEQAVGPNANFLRPEAALAILVLSDEDDGSVRDCSRHDGYGECADAEGVYDPASTRWASPDLNLRLYDYDPGGAQDPTWPLDRYVDPAHSNRGFLALKPGHPERILFAAFTGVPVGVGRSGAISWDGLLGPPLAGRTDAFAARDAAAAYRNDTDREGPTSMRQRDRDPSCSTRMLPACRAPGTAPSCNAIEQPFAWRARRLTEVARRFSESALCDGRACGNGLVSSICDTADGAPFARFAEMIARRVVR